MGLALHCSCPPLNLISGRLDESFWHHQPLQTKPRGIYWALRSRVDENIVQKAAKRTSQKRSNDGDPEIVSASGPDLMAIPNRIRHQRRTKISSQVDSIPCLISKTSPETENQKEKSQREEWAGPCLTHRSGIGLILQGEDHKL